MENTISNSFKEACGIMIKNYEKQKVIFQDVGETGRALKTLTAVVEESTRLAKEVIIPTCKRIAAKYKEAGM